ncbi:MAG: hypothetical protein ABIR24_07735 [Verrucomicrobiota bacterium]
MKNRLAFKFMVAATLCLGTSAAIAQTTTRAKTEMPPLPPGLVLTEDGKTTKVVASQLPKAKASKSEDATIAANNPAPGSAINEPAGAELPAKTPELSTKSETPK